MSTEITLGGERLGSGKKQKVYLHGYERSNHDLGYTWRSSMSAGTLVPFMTEVGLPGDSFDIDLNCDVLTLPTIGPLFGSFKVQLDVFVCPIRLYQGKLHMNLLNIGLKMQDVKLPQLYLTGNPLPDAYENLGNIDIDNYHINPSCILSYLGIRGLGVSGKDNIDVENDVLFRKFNAIPYLSYWDIYKNYYANKQEEHGYVIHNPLTVNTIDTAKIYDNNGTLIYTLEISTDGTIQNESTWLDLNNKVITLSFDNNVQENELNNIYISSGNVIEGYSWIPIIDFPNIVVNETIVQLSGLGQDVEINAVWFNTPNINNLNTAPVLKKFPLENIDKMREFILMNVTNPSNFIVNTQTIEEEGVTPYSLIDFNVETENGRLYSKLSSQEGLGVKCYQSDLFNNWIDTEFITGDNGINEITAVDVSDGKLLIDELIFSKKVYEMLNRIAISGGTYDDWLDATYTHERAKSIENPMYVGGLIKELVFQEVVSTAASSDSPLGTLAGRGRLTSKHKGGSIKIKIDEPSYVISICSITPRLDYSQGNKWDTNLDNMNDLHKPQLDQIGFQDLITDQMAWWETWVYPTDMTLSTPEYFSAGKQPAWVNYMTNVNKCYGAFAVANEMMYMTLNRRYQPKYVLEDTAMRSSIKDLTTYIDPSKFNYLFADTRLDAQNFMVQIRVDNYARRKMSAKVMPNL